VRRERMLIKFGGVQPNRSVPAEGLSNNNGTPVGYPRPDPDLRGQPHGQRWLAAKSGVAVVVVAAQPGVKSLTTRLHTQKPAIFPQATSERDAELSCWTVDLILPLTGRRYTSCIEGAEHAAGLGPVSSPFSAAALDWIHRLDIDLVHVTRSPLNSLSLTHT